MPQLELSTPSDNLSKNDTTILILLCTFSIFQICQEVFTIFTNKILKEKRVLNEFY